MFVCVCVCVCGCGCVGVCSIGYSHSHLSSFGTSNFFKKKMCVPTRGYFYLLSSQLRSPLAGAVALFVLHLLHSTGYWYLCSIDQLRVRR